MKKRLCNLLTVKSLVTLALTGTFVYLAVSDRISADYFMTIFATVIAFYFGTQHFKRTKEDDSDDGDNS